MHRVHHLAHDRETRLGDEIEVGGDRADQRILDRQETQLGATLDDRLGDVTELAMRLRLRVRLEQDECFLRVGTRLALKCYPLVCHWLTLMAPGSCRKIAGRSYCRLMTRTNTEATPAPAPPPCPDCGAGTVRQSGCLVCVQCGWAGCGWPTAVRRSVGRNVGRGSSRCSRPPIHLSARPPPSSWMSASAARSSCSSRLGPCSTHRSKRASISGRSTRSSAASSAAATVTRATRTAMWSSGHTTRAR